MKHGNSFYLELPRTLFTDKYKNLSINAKWLYVVLNELEQRFTGKKENFFTRTNDQLCEDTGMSLSTLKRAKAELIETDLVETWKCHTIYGDTGKMSTLYRTAYRIL